MHNQPFASAKGAIFHTTVRLCYAAFDGLLLWLLWDDFFASPEDAPPLSFWSAVLICWVVTCIAESAVSLHQIRQKLD
jgi:hypothetical protein